MPSGWRGHRVYNYGAFGMKIVNVLKDRPKHWSAICCGSLATVIEFHDSGGKRSFHTIVSDEKDKFIFSKDIAHRHNAIRAAKRELLR